MKRLVNALILFASLGCKADSWRDPSMVYEFDTVSLELCRTTTSNQRLLSFLTSHLD